LKKDRILTISVVLITSLIIYLITRDFFLDFAATNKIIAGFIKFFVLATIGDFVGIRFKSGMWKKPKNVLYKAFVWGFIGIVIVLIFDIFFSGVASLQDSNILPFKESALATAFFVSVLMNVTFAPTMMAFHRVTDTYLDLKADGESIRFKEVVGRIDFQQFFNVVVLKTIPFFWIPAHTITFILPVEYRVIFAAILGIFLGLILGITSTKK